VRNRLYVTNLPEAPTEAALRDCFARAGEVSEVSIVERETGRPRIMAFVTMKSESAARKAVEELDGVYLGGEALRVVLAHESSAQEDEQQREDAKRAASEKRARIMQQFRERENMTYELECTGTPLIVRVFFRVDDGPAPGFRIEARTSDAPGTPFVGATGSSKLKALQEVAQKCLAADAPRALTAIDWIAVEQAMMTVHAV